MKQYPKNDSLGIFAQAAQELSLARDLETVTKIVRTVARRLTGADGASFILLEGDFCFYADEDAISPLWKGQRFPLNDCVSGWVMKHAQPAVIKDIYKDERVPVEAYKPTFVKSLAVVPIRTLSPIGAIGNYWATQYEPGEEEMQVLQALADLTSVALENVRVYAELENKVKERTAQLEARNRDLETLSYSLSHDLRAPLRSINFYVATLKEELGYNTPVTITALNEKISKKTGVMIDLIDKLLVYFTAEAETAHATTVSMQALVTGICKDLKEEQPHQQTEYIIHPLPQVQGDELLLKQVWINLISNATKYSSKQDKPVVEIGCQPAENGATFYVKDNGTGFAPGDKENLFKAFNRLHARSDFEGSGLGLAIVERILSKFDGLVWAEGETGKGATFYFHLPHKKDMNNDLSIPPAIISKAEQ